jgi:hypothetical protein
MEDSSGLTAEDLRQFTSEKQDILDNNPQMNEEETKTAVVTDFVNLLGWEIPQDGHMEYQFGGHTTNIVDYAFFHNGVSKLFTEAKPYGATIKEKNRNQIKEYLKLDDVDLGILTNGGIYEFYRRFVNDDQNVEIQRIARIPLREFPDNAVLISTFSAPQVKNGKYAERLERINALQTAQETLTDNQEQLATDIVEVVTDSVGSIAHQPAENNVVEFLDCVGDDLAEMTPTRSQTATDSAYSVVQDETGIKFTDDEVHFTDDGSARDHFRSVIQVLFGHGYLSHEDLPIPSGPTRYILNTEPVDREGNEMRDGEEVVEGVYVELHANTDSLKRYVQKVVATATGEHETDTSSKGTDESSARATGSPSLQMVDGTIVDEETGEPAFPVASLDDLTGSDSAKVGVYAADFDRGVPFIAEQNAWGFINIASEPEYFCIYINRPHQQVQLIGEVKDIIDQQEFLATHDYNGDLDDVADSKKVITFDDIYQLEAPIQFGESQGRMQGLLYTTLKDLKTAATTDDL